MSLIDLITGTWRSLAIGAAVGVVAGGGGVWWLRDQMAAQGQLSAAHAETRQAHAVTRRVQRQGEVTATVEASHAAAAEHVRTVTRTITQEIPHVVTVEVDRSFGSLPVGLLRVYNASGQALELSAVPDPAGRPDGAASGIYPSTFAAFGSDNNGAANECRVQLTALQEWVRAQAALATETPRP